MIEAQYSAPYCLALCAVHGPDALVPIHQTHLIDPAVLSLAAKVAVRHDPEIDSLFPERSPAWVSVHLTDGRLLTSQLTDPRGDPARALTWSALQSKFITATRKTLPGPLQERILKSVDLLREGDLEPLRAALRLSAGQ